MFLHQSEILFTGGLSSHNAMGQAEPLPSIFYMQTPSEGRPYSEGRLPHQHPPPPRHTLHPQETVNWQTVRILLECILVLSCKQMVEVM